ncbi:bacteriohemerythrin [Melaminivora sp.]
MAYFEWADDMEVGHEQIDADHRRLVEQVNTLHSATREGRGQEVVGALLAEVVRDTIEHVRREEQFLESIHFPETAGHRQGHERFVQELRALQTRYEAGQITVAAQLSALLRDWLSLHIRRSDKEIRNFLRTTAPRSQRPPRLSRP